MTHTQVIIVIISVAGLLGGVTNFFLLYDIKSDKKEFWVNFTKSMLLGLCASITVPLFLQILQTNLLEVQRDSAFPDKNYFILFGFCVVAAIYSKQFLENVNDKLANLNSKVEKAKQEAEEAKNKAAENKRELKNTKTEFFNNEDANAIKEDKPVKATETAVDNSFTGSPNTRENTMLAVASGLTFDDNLKYDIYYDPALRNHSTPFKFIGLYKSWGIRAVGEVKKIVYCDYDEEKNILIPTRDEEVFKGLTKEELKKIKDIIVNTKYYDLQTGNKFFLVDKFYRTEYTLGSPIMGKQYFWLNRIQGFNENMSASDLAELLLNRSDV